MKKNYLLLLISLLISCSLMGQETVIKTDAPDNVAAGTNFRIVYTVNKTGGKFIPPRFDDSFSVNGPSVSTSSNTQWINGSFSSTSATSYVFFVVAVKEGTFTIPAAQYALKNTTVSSAPITITVSAAGSSSPASSSGSARNQRTAASGEEVYLRYILNTDQVYIGQPVEVKLKIFTRIQISNSGSGVLYPDFKGFLKTDIKIPQLQNLDMESINGVQYGTGVIEKFLLYPQVSGDLKIDRAQMQVLVQQKTGFDDDPFFGGSLFSNIITAPRTISSLPVTIHVKPLPAPQPADFSGAVGKFGITSSLSKESVQANDAVNYTMTLSGTGNVAIAGPPAIEVPATIEKYDPKVTVNAQGNSGSKTFEFLLIPRHSGEFVIPGLNYTYFDISSGRYVTLKTEDRKIKVLPGSGNSESSPAITGTTDKEDVKYLGQDIRFIRTGNYRLSEVKQPKVESTTYYLIYLLALVLAVCAVAVTRQYLRRNSDSDMARNRKAAAVAGKRLKKAQESLKAGDYNLMNEEIAKALWGYLSDKLLIPLSELTTDNCVAALAVKNIQPELISELQSILDTCEYSRFAPSSANDSPEGLYARSEKLIGSLENVL